jgi:hypothetical protein
MRYIVSWVIVCIISGIRYNNRIVLTFSSKEAAERLYNMESKVWYNPNYYIDSLKIDSLKTK